MARPMTAVGGSKPQESKAVSSEQQAILNDIRKGHARAIIRPQTAATTSIKDEFRILTKLKMLEKIEQKIEDDLEQFVNRRGDQTK